MLELKKKIVDMFNLDNDEQRNTVLIDTFLDGIYKGYNIDIYTSFNNGFICHKLFYVKNNVGEWIKSKLIYFENNKIIKKVISENKRRGNDKF